MQRNFSAIYFFSYYFTSTRGKAWLNFAERNSEG